MNPGAFVNPPQGYGVREPTAERPLVGGESRLALRARPSIALMALVPPGIFAAAVASHGVDAFLRGLGNPKVLLYCFVLIVAAVQGVWLLLFPVFRTDLGEMRARPFVFGRAARHPRESIVWRSGRRFVGRFLLAEGPRGRTVRLPLWLLPRRGQERLFAWLDATARTESPG